MSIIEREDLRRGLASIEREINGLVQGRQLIEKAWGFFKIMGKEDIAEAINIAARKAEEEIERLRKAKQAFEAALKEVK